MKLLIVDDEELLRQKLVRIVEDSRLHFETVLTAPDAFEAMAVIDEYKPEIILTDIRMPQKSGLDLAKYVHEHYPDLTVILITGYSDFDYAQAGIRYQVFEYLLKPVSKDQAVACLEKAQRKYQSEQKHRSLYAVLQKYFSENFETAKKQFLENLLFHPIDYNEDIMEQQKRQFHLQFIQYRLISVKFILDAPSQFHSPPHGPEEEYFYAYVIQQRISEMLPKAFTYFFGNIVYFLYPMDVKDSDRDLLDSIMALKRSSESVYPFQMLVGISQIGDSLLGIKSLKKQAAICLEHLSNSADVGVIYYDDIVNGERNTVDVTDLIAQLNTAIRITNIARAQNCLQKILTVTQALDDGFKRSTAQLIVSNLSFTLHELQLDLKKIGELHESAAQIMNGGFAQMEKSLSDWLEEICEAVQTFYKVNNNQLIRSITDYINQNYMKQIGLTDAAEHVGRNPSYISRLFKQNTDKNFTQMLTEKRVIEAKELLSHTNLKISEVAEQVGYPNLRYFNRIFANHTGMTAGDYRKVVSAFSGNEQ